MNTWNREMVYFAFFEKWSRNMDLTEEIVKIVENGGELTKVVK